MKKPTAAQTADCITQIVELAHRLRTLESAVRRRAGTTGRDGYPPTSGPGGVHGATGDPVGNLVVLRIDEPHRDPIAAAHRKLCATLDEARKLLEEAESTGKKALPPTSPISDDGCVSCARIKRWSPIHRGRRCSWCYTWATSQGGGDPPIDILHAHHEGRRVTVRLVAALHRQRKHG